MLFMVLKAKDALGRIPRLNEDLLDVQKNFLDTVDMFWLVIDEHDSVIGSIGCNFVPSTTEVIQVLFDEGKLVHTLDYFFTTEELVVNVKDTARQ